MTPVRCLAIAALAFVLPAIARESRAAVTSTTLVYYDPIDLETGTVDATFEPAEVFGKSGQFDFHFSYGPNPPVRVTQNEPWDVQIALLKSTSFESMTYEMASQVTLTKDLIDAPFEFGDTFLIRTYDGNLFKLGHPVDLILQDPYPQTAVSFDYERLVPVPEPNWLAVSAGTTLAFILWRKRRS